MKKIIPILIAALTGCLLSSCHSDEGFLKETPRNLQIVATDLFFSPSGGTGSITFQAEGTVRATAEKEWCSVAVSGHQVQITVPAHSGVESRYSLVTLQCQDEKATFTVQQSGEVIDGLLQIGEITAPVAGNTQEFPFKANIPLTVSSAQDWIHGEVVDGNLLRVTIDENLTPGTRLGTLDYTLGLHEGSFPIVQYPAVRRENGWTISLSDGKFEYPNQVNTITVTAADELADQKYVMALVPQSSMKTPIEDYIFDEVAPDMQHQIQELIDDGTIASFGEALTAGHLQQQAINLPKEVYVVLVGFGDNGFVSGLYQYALLQVEDLLPMYYKWAGTWVSTPFSDGTNDYTEEWVISIDEDNLEKNLKIRGLDGHSSAEILAAEGDLMNLRYNNDGTVTLTGQQGVNHFTYRDYGESCLAVRPLYTKNGGSSYTAVNSNTQVVFTASLSEDGMTMTLTPGVRTSGGVDYDIAGFRLGLHALETDKYYNLGASHGMVPLSITLTKKL